MELTINTVKHGKPKIYDKNSSFYAVCEGNSLLQSFKMAELFKAAPELLKACNYVIKYHRENDSGEGELFGLDFVTTCIAAVRKAEGK